MAEFNYVDLYRRTWGYEPPTRQVDIPAATPRKETSLLGQPYYDTDIQGREYFMPVYLDGYLIPFAVMSMYWKNTYVSTSMPERGGSVKELISVDDYVFSLKGLFINSLNEWPEQGVIDIHNIFRKGSSVTLRSVISAIVLSGEFNERVIIKDVRWPDMQGVEHAAAFEMTLESDMIFELILS